MIITNQQSGTNVHEVADDMLERLAATKPTTLACMHGSAWHGDGAGLLQALASELSA